MGDNKSYCPILRWKRGEQRALHELTKDVKANILPLADISTIPYDYEKECLKKTLDEHLSSVSKSIRQNWGTQNIMLDINWLTEDSFSENGDYALKTVLDSCISENLNVIPVVSFDNGDNYLDAVAQYCSATKKGIVLRIKKPDGKLILSLKSKIDLLLSKLKVEINESYVVYDLSYLNDINIDDIAVSIINLINFTPYINLWDNIYFVSTSFPKDASVAKINTTASVPRLDWQSWKEIITSEVTLQRKPCFGDYVINNPETEEIDPRLIYKSMTASIRYTSDENYYIFRGDRIEKKGWEQSHAICKRIISSKHIYLNSSYSYGDKYIYDCANNTVTCGSGETWREVGTNHHITYVVNQLSTLSYS